MCGFAGFVEFSLSKISKDDLMSMQKAISHRGPDDTGCFIENGVGLAHARLSIIDLSEKAHQPMVQDDLVLAYNGEIFNFKEIREELRSFGHRFQSDSDTEVVLKAYKQWGKDSLLKFNGMFAFAIYNRREKTIFLARDRLGIKPFFYYRDETKIVFSSEIKAIRQVRSLDGKGLSLEALEDYLQFGYTTGMQTIWKNFYRLLPGEYMQVDIRKSKILVDSYWRPQFTSESKIGFEDTVGKTQSILIDEVQKSLISDVPVGVCLSGGVDSNILTAIIAKELGIKLKTYSLGSNDTLFDENRQASEVAKYLGTDHTSIILDPIKHKDFFLETIAHYDEPITDPNPLSYRLIAQKAKEDGVSVLLSGLGGDELFLGYPGTALSKKIKRLFKIPYALRKHIPKNLFNFSNKLNKGAELLAAKELVSALGYISGKCFWDCEVDQLLSNHRQRERNADSHFLKVLESEKELVNQIMTWDLKSYLPDNGLHISDMSTMAEGVEMRVPFLNNSLIDFGLQIPARLKTKGGRLKAILRKVEERYLPKELLIQKKRGFYPFRKEIWIGSYLKNEVEHFLDYNYLKKQGIFNSDAFKDIVVTNQEFKPNVSSRIWNMLMFQMWAQNHI